MENYSSRFSMTGMTGANPATAAAAVQALEGSTKGPDTVNNVGNNAAAGAAGANAAGGAAFTVAYNLQTGLTKYAPMQPVPPTKITKKNPTPLNPTSAYSVATTWMPRPTILTTLTASQTFSASSRENTVSPDAHATLRICADIIQGCRAIKPDRRHAEVLESLEGLSRAQ